MNFEQYEIELLTATLCHGAAPKEEAELRVPSIRGQLRRWHTVLWGQQSTNECWGFVPQHGGKSGQASKVVIRLQEKKTSTQKFRLLPHKTWHGQSPGIPMEEVFKMLVSYRYLKQEEEQAVMDKVRATIKIWLLLGTLGLRGSRAFGSVWDKRSRYSTPQAFLDTVANILRSSQYGQKYHVQLLKLEKPSARGDELMKICTNTVGGSPALLGGITPRRQISPLKMKFVDIGGMYYLALHAKNKDIVEKGRELLKDKPVGKCTIVATL